MEDILAITFIFGGGSLFLLSISPLGRAFAERIRSGGQQPAPPAVDEAVYEELDRLRSEMNEVHERLDFAERLLTEAQRLAAVGDRPAPAPAVSPGGEPAGGGH